MKVIGLTGNIACGKSLVASMFKDLGASVIDVDDIARTIVEPGKDAWTDIVKTFGEAILYANRTINRKALGEIIFNDEEKRTKLNDITHPRIIGAARELVEKYQNEGSDLIIVEAALIVEKGGLKDLIDGLIVVIANQETQFERLTKRDGLSKEEAISRINSQMPTKEKVEYADYIIDNSGTEEETKSQVKNLWQELRSQ